MKKIPCRCQAHWAVPGVILIWGILVLLLQEASVSQPFTVIMRWGMSLMMTLCRNLGNVLDTLAAHIPPSEWPLKNYLHPADFLVHPYLIHPLHRDVSTFQHFLVGKVPISLLPGIIQIFNKQLSGKDKSILDDKHCMFYADIRWLPITMSWIVESGNNNKNFGSFPHVYSSDRRSWSCHIC